MSYEPFNLAGKVALITGGNGGSGLGMADALARAGADVVIWGNNPSKNQTAEVQLRAHGTRVLVKSVDVADEAAVISGVAHAIDAMGRVDFVAANAGVGKSAA